MPEGELKHLRVRHPDMFSRFRVITKIGHLDEDDQKLVRKKVPKNKRGHAKFTVGKLKGDRKIHGHSWKLQKIMVKQKGGGGNVGKKKAKKKSRRKTFKKKSTAKKARQKGQSVYKVKGGWRLTKK